METRRAAEMEVEADEEVSVKNLAHISIPGTIIAADSDTEEDLLGCLNNIGEHKKHHKRHL
jgi:hypothetical protein